MSNAKIDQILEKLSGIDDLKEEITALRQMIESMKVVQVKESKANTNIKQKDDETKSNSSDTPTKKKLTFDEYKKEKEAALRKKFQELGEKTKRNTYQDSFDVYLEKMYEGYMKR